MTSFNCVPFPPKKIRTKIPSAAATSSAQFHIFQIQLQNLIPPKTMCTYIYSCPHKMANDNAPYIKLYINVYLKNYTSDLRERPSMTSGKYTTGPPDPPLFVHLAGNVSKWQKEKRTKHKESSGNSSRGTKCIFWPRGEKRGRNIAARWNWTFCSNLSQRNTSSSAVSTRFIICCNWSLSRQPHPFKPKQKKEK